MKRKPLVTWFSLRFALLIAPLVAAWPQRAQAVPLYWDINGATANVAASVTGTGGWDGFNALWTSGANAATGTGVPQAGTTAADDLFFS